MLKYSFTSVAFGTVLGAAALSLTGTTLTSRIPLATIGSAMADEPSALFSQGLRDRTKWENWSSALTGDRRAGAEYWASQRSESNPGNCAGTPDFTKGCNEAKARLSGPDVLRKSEPDYKAGWNSYMETATPAPVQPSPDKAQQQIAAANQGDIDKAIADATERIRRDPRRAWRYQERGELYFKKGDFAQAINDFNQAIKMDATRAFRFHWRGLAYSRIGNFPAAIADFTESIRLDPVKRGFRFHDRAKAFRATGQYALAISDYDEVLQLDPTNGQAFLDRGRAHAMNDQITLAKSDFEAALRIAGDENPELRQAATDEMAALSPSPPKAVAAPQVGGSTPPPTVPPVPRGSPVVARPAPVQPPSPFEQYFNMQRR